MSSPLAPTIPGLAGLPPLSEFPPIGPNYGALLVGTFLSLILYGVELHQLYRYIRLYSTDRSLIKCYVAVLVLLDTFHTVLTMHTSYWYLVTNYFKPLILLTPMWSLMLQPMTTGLIIILSQLFYARRVFLLDKRYRHLVAITLVMFAAELGFAIAFTVKAFKLVIFDADTLTQMSWIQSAAFGIVVLADIILTCVLILSLSQNRTGFKRTDSMLDVLIAYAICTGLLTDVVTMVCFILDRIAPGELLFGAADMICVKVYVNSVLAVLNTRQSFASGVHSDFNLSLVVGEALGGITPQHAGSQTSVSKPWATSESKTVAHTDSAVVDIKLDDVAASQV
ncbi:hypothetical protein VTO73DRAFT_8770 [Trametes versicolor]